MSGQVAIDATKVCVDCGRERPVSKFDRRRNQCNSCRHADEKARLLARTDAGTGAIPPAELRRRAAVRGHVAPGLTAWLVAEGYATKVDGGLAPTKLAVELAGPLA